MLRGCRPLSKSFVKFGHSKQIPNPTRGRTSLRYFANQSKPANQSELVPNYFAEQVKRSEFRDIFVHPEQKYRFTYKDLDHVTTGLATGLLEVFTPGDKLVYMAQNETDNLVTHIAAAKSGISFVSFNPKANIDEIETLVRNFKPNGFIWNTKLHKPESFYRIYPEIENYLLRDRDLQFFKYPFTKGLIFNDYDGPSGFMTFKNLLLYNRYPSLVAQALPKLKASDFVTIHASVSNDNVQAVAYTHSHLLNTAHSISQALSFSSDDRVCFAIGLAQFRAQALMWSCIGNRSVIVVPSVSLELQVESVLRTLSTEKCTNLVIDSNGLEKVLAAVKETKKYDLSSLKRVIIPSSLSSGLANSASQTLGVQSVYSIDFSSGTVFNELQGKGALLPNLESKIVNGNLAVKGFVVPQTISGNTSVDTNGFYLTQEKVSKDASGQLIRA
mmetsp:Transcript_27535/g.38843  ORF Transcript_27535/g.38843 Transcript_27535/m.38843 type:complete len:443 (-) Transcript_27535:1363-2691(-)